MQLSMEDRMNSERNWGVIVSPYEIELKSHLKKKKQAIAKQKPNIFFAFMTTLALP
jgi:hypothetical protein